jgi:hypothetical protein
MNKMQRFAAMAVFLWTVCPAVAAAAAADSLEDSGPSSAGQRKAIDGENNRQRQSAPRIMVVVPETLLGRPRIPDPAGETELIRRLVEANFRVLDSSEVAQIRYSDEMGHIIKEADVKAMKALCKQHHCDLFIAGEAFSEQVNERPAHDVAPITAHARIEVKAFVVETGEILAANAAVGDATDLAPAVAGKTALQNAATKLAEYLVPRIRTAIDEGRVSQAMPPPPPPTPYVLYGVAGGVAMLVLAALVLVVLLQQRRVVAQTSQSQTPVDPRLSGLPTNQTQSPNEK